MQGDDGLVFDSGHLFTVNAYRHVEDYPRADPSVESVDHYGVHICSGTNRSCPVVQDPAPDMDPRTVDQLPLDGIVGESGPDGRMNDAEFCIKAKVLTGPLPVISPFVDQGDGFGFEWFMKRTDRPNSIRHGQPGRALGPDFIGDRGLHFEMPFVDRWHAVDEIVGIDGGGKLDKRSPPLEPSNGPSVYNRPGQVRIDGHPGDNRGAKTSGSRPDIGVDRVSSMFGEVSCLYRPRCWYVCGALGHDPGSFRERVSVGVPLFTTGR